MKKTVITVIICGIIFTSIGVFAGSYNAKQVTYTPSDNTWDVNNVKDAIDSLKVQIGSEVEIIDQGYNLTAPKTIDIEEGSYIALSGFNNIQTDGIEIYKYTALARTNDNAYGLALGIYKANKNKMNITIPVGGNKNFGYVIFK